MSLTQKSAVTAIAMDMHDPYRTAVSESFPEPGPAVVHDRFHIAKHKNEALNDVRKGEARKLTDADDRTLVGSRQLWLWGEENIPEKRLPAFEKLKKSDLAIVEVWSQKENLRRLWDHTGVRAARKHFNLKTASATRLRRAALHEARNGVSHSIASCALQLGHSCDFQGTKWVARKDS